MPGKWLHSPSSSFLGCDLGVKTALASQSACEDPLRTESMKLTVSSQRHVISSELRPAPHTLPLRVSREAVACLGGLVVLQEGPIPGLLGGGRGGPPSWDPTFPADLLRLLQLLTPLYSLKCTCHHVIHEDLHRFCHKPL